MHIHILGIGGKLMSGMAMIAHALGHKVSGCDANLDSPLCRQLRELDITLKAGYEPSHLSDDIDAVMVGNVMSRGNPLIEEMMNKRMRYYSAPEWLAEFVLRDRWVIAVSGTHGKTTTTSLISFILDQAGLDPSFMIGGNANDFAVSGRIGSGKHFVIEADEYDSAFFDKRPKFLHYLPTTLIINNIEFDHADIYTDLNAVKKQFEYLLRAVPGNGQIIVPSEDENVNDVISRGCWSSVVKTGKYGNWQAKILDKAASHFEVFLEGKSLGEVHWKLLGKHNIQNALAALAAVYHAGVSPEVAIKAMNKFQGVERRLEFKGELNGVKIYDDFAHHPTAIAMTLDGFKAKNNTGKITLVVDFGSNSMKCGAHKDKMQAALEQADRVALLKPANCDWDLDELLGQLSCPGKVYENLDELNKEVFEFAQAGDFLIIMTNQNTAKIQKALGL